MHADSEIVEPFVVAHSDLSDDPGAAPIWSEWGRLTRFLESARLAFARERNLWATLDLRSADEVKLSAATHHGTYKVGLNQHLAAVRDEETLFASVLIHSYALAESAAAERLGGHARDFGGIETGAREYSRRQDRGGSASRRALPVPSRSQWSGTRTRTAVGGSTSRRRTASLQSARPRRRAGTS